MSEMAPMKLPVRFPSEADKIYEEAQAFRRLPPHERVQTMFDLIASGMHLLEMSPKRETARRLHEAQEMEWQRIHRELFARHAR
jgi:hypothetical protein